jgi:pimeloyl-ACP methyl ester carboxylesterase
MMREQLGRTVVALLAIVLSARASADDPPPYAFKATGFDPAVILASDDSVAVAEHPGHWLFSPKKDARPTALVFCPGGMVDPVAYAPLARAVAARGYATYVIKPSPGWRPPELQKREGVAMVKALVGGERQVKAWVVGGHSLGGAVAARFAHEQPGLLSGLLLCGTTHPRDFDLSKFDRPVTKVYATNDGVADAEQTRRNGKLLPARTRWVVVEGGNHAQFGWYGPQPGDRPATISREQQQEALVRAAVELLGEAGDEPGH